MVDSRIGRSAVDTMDDTCLGKKTGNLNESGSRSKKSGIPDFGSPRFIFYAACGGQPMFALKGFEQQQDSGAGGLEGMNGKTPRSYSAMMILTGTVAERPRYVGSSFIRIKFRAIRARNRISDITPVSVELRMRRSTDRMFDGSDQADGLEA